MLYFFKASYETEYYVKSTFLKSLKKLSGKYQHWWDDGWLFFSFFLKFTYCEHGLCFRGREKS